MTRRKLPRRQIRELLIAGHASQAHELLLAMEFHKAADRLGRFHRALWQFSVLRQEHRRLYLCRYPSGRLPTIASRQLQQARRVSYLAGQQLHHSWGIVHQVFNFPDSWWLEPWERDSPTSHAHLAERFTITEPSEMILDQALLRTDGLCSRPTSLITWEPIGHIAKLPGGLSFLGTELGRFSGIEVLPAPDNSWWIQLEEYHQTTRTFPYPVPHDELGLWVHHFLRPEMPQWNWLEVSTLTAPPYDCGKTGGNRLGYVYFIQDIESRSVKIGFSYSPRKRLADLNSASSGQRRLLRLLPGRFTAENTLHRYFREERISGEWFTASERMARYLDNIPKRGWGAYPRTRLADLRRSP